MTGSKLSLEPEKPSTEQLKDQLSDQQRVIFDFLRANPEHGFTYKEIGEVLDESKHTVRKWIVERGMVDDNYRMNGTIFEGIVTHKRENNAKYWYIKPEIEDRLDEPPVKIEKHEVEIPRYDSLIGFVKSHASQILAFEAIYVFALIMLIWIAETLFGLGVPTEWTIWLIVFSSLGMLGMMLLIGYRDTRIYPKYREGDV